MRRKSDEALLATYSYDAAGRRQRKVVTNSGELNGQTDYYYDSWRVLEERGGSDQPTQQFVYGIFVDETLVRDVLSPGPAGAGTGSSRSWYHQNTLFSTFALSNDQGTIVQGYQYDAHGNVQVTAGSSSGLDTSNPYLFTGRRRDHETGLNYFRARYQDPELGRFLSRDPLTYAGGLNLYEYASSSPTAFVDPSGLLSAEARVEGSNPRAWLSGWRRGTITYSHINIRFNYQQPNPNLINDSTYSARMTIDWRFGVRLSGNPVDNGCLAQFQGTIDVQPTSISGVKDDQNIRRHIRGARVERLWKRRSESAAQARAGGTSTRTGGRCVECAIFDQIMEFDSVSDAVAEYVAGQISQSAVGLIPGGSRLGTAARNAGASLASTSANSGPRVILVICADGKRYVGVFNLPKPNLEGQHGNTLHFWGSSAWVYSDPGGPWGNGSPPLIFNNYWEASN